MIAADADVLARMPLVAALANDDAACVDALAAELDSVELNSVTVGTGDGDTDGGTSQ